MNQLFLYPKHVREKHPTPILISDIHPAVWPFPGQHPVLYVIDNHKQRVRYNSHRKMPLLHLYLSSALLPVYLRIQGFDFLISFEHVSDYIKESKKEKKFLNKYSFSWKQIRNRKY